MRGWRTTVAHAATPWEWRSEVGVVALAVLGVALLVASIVLTVTSERWGVGGLVVSVVVGSLLFTWPAIRSWRRWKVSQRDGRLIG